MFALTHSIEFTLSWLSPSPDRHLKHVQRVQQERQLQAAQQGKEEEEHVEIDRIDGWDVYAPEYTLAQQEGLPRTPLSCAWLVERISAILAYRLMHLDQQQLLEAAPDLVWTAFEGDVGYVLGSVLRKTGVQVQRKQWTPQGQPLSFLVLHGQVRGSRRNHVQHTCHACCTLCYAGCAGSDGDRIVGPRAQSTL